VNTETVAVAPLSQRFALKLSYAVRYNNAPPFRNDVRLQRTDRFFSTTLTYTY
jgi:putative salt-induced outer membrane protein YdiY